MTPRILCAVDFSECSHAALAHALLLAKSTGAKIDVLHAYYVPAPIQPALMLWMAKGPRPAWLDEDQRFWLVLDKPNVELCLTDPGFDVGLDIEADLGEMTRVYLGQLSLSEAVGSGAVELTGRRDLRRGLGNWLGISPFAPARPKAPRRVAAV